MRMATFSYSVVRSDTRGNVPPNVRLKLAGAHANDCYYVPSCLVRLLTGDGRCWVRVF